MADSTLLQDNRVKLIVVMLPALAFTAWIASQVATDEYFIPALAVGGTIIALLFSVFLHSVRMEAAVTCLLLTGYLVGNRGFADLSPFKPLYPGELTMLIIASCVLLRFALTREFPDLTGWMARTILIYCALGAVRLPFDFSTYRLDAIRDAAMVYYSAFYFCGRELVVRASSRVLLESCLKFAFVALVPIAVVERYFPELIFTLTSSGGFNLFFQKDDILTTFSAVAAFILYTRPHIFRKRWLRVGLILFYLVFVVTGFGRASLAALAVGSVLLFVAGQRRFFVYPALGMLAGLLLVAGYAAGYGESQDSAPAIFVDKFSSMVDISGRQNYASEYGEIKASNNEFRRQLWESFVEETNAVSPMFGRGFGYDFISRFESTFQRGEWEGLRSAHNFYVTLYGRLGAVGLLVFVAITVQIFAGGFQAARLAHQGLYPVEDLGFWCGTWAILVSSAVGVVLESPVGAVVFWTFLGVAAQCSKQANLALVAASNEEPELVLAPTLPPERRPVPYRSS